MKDSNGNLIDEVITYEADGDFLKTLGLKLLQGKSLYPNPSHDDVIVNEAFLKRLTSAEALGQEITQEDENTSSRVRTAISVGASSVWSKTFTSETCATQPRLPSSPLPMMRPHIYLRNNLSREKY